MASRDAVALTGGPDWEVKLGRLDSLTASQEDSNNIMPSPSSLQNTAPSKCQVSYHNCPCALACCKAAIDIEPVMFAAAVRIATNPTSWKYKASSHHA